MRYRLIRNNAPAVNPACASAVPLRVSSVRSPACFAYDLSGLLSRQALDGVSGVLERRYQYDVLDRLTGISDSHWGEQALRLNGTGQVVAERREQGRQQQARLFGYDSEKNLCEISAIVPDGAGRLSTANAVVQASAGYDAAGRVVRRGDSRYQYDACGRLVNKRCQQH
ncbi:hypothetical protein [Dickeya oryzae]|uniref:RHS repeat protein n=1 Tax=Dickeya oryzae TaxID=1240404 RepID=A0AB39IKE2_9GAMM